jgi:glycosyltransferase involved in cell wall biosynthesis
VHCPRLETLPSPPTGRDGWPWTVESPLLPPARPDGTPWPRISIVTPSYNQGQYIEETIRSILLQGYPDLEYIVIDGGSTDNSAEIIRRYEPWLAYWISEKDGGQADAINNGLARSSGEIFQFINSDDFLDHGALQIVATLMPDHDCVSGPVIEFKQGGATKISYASTALSVINFVRRPAEFFYHQPGVWLRTALAAAVGGFDAELHYKFDWEFMLRYLDRYPRVAYSERNLGFSRLHPAAKTVAQGAGFGRETVIAQERALDGLRSGTAKSELLRIVRQTRWQQRVDEAVKDGSAATIMTTLRLCFAALENPTARIDRYFLGAIRKLLLGSR